MWHMRAIQEKHTLAPQVEPAQLAMSLAEPPGTRR